MKHDAGQHRRGQKGAREMKDWKQVLMGLCKVKSIVTLLLTGTFMALALRGDVAAKDFYSVMVMVLTFYFGYQSAKAEDRGGAQ